MRPGFIHSVSTAEQPRSSRGFRTKPQIALDLIDRAKANGIEVIAWTADELYGRDGAFLDGLDARNEAFVIEVPPNAHVWLMKPKELKTPPQNAAGRPKKYPRLRSRERQPSEVQNLAAYSPAFRKQTPKKYRIKDSHRGSEVWEIRWAKCWRKTHTDNVVIDSMTYPPRTRERLYTEEAARQSYYARRNAQASKSHRKTRRKQLAALGIDPDKIKSVPPKHAN